MIRVSFVIDKLYVWKGDESNKANHHFLIPNSLRAIVVGKSGCGKSTCVNNLLLKPGMLDYDRLYVFATTLHQPEYQIMKSAFDKKLSKNQLRTLFANQDEIVKLGGPLKVIEEYEGNVLAVRYKLTFIREKTKFQIRAS